jgi:hypothetical protein
MRFSRSWVYPVAIAVATVFVFAAFGVHVVTGGAYEPRTVVAMSLRTVVWIVIAVIAWFVWIPAKTMRG